MNLFSVKRLVLALILSVGSFLTLPAYAWQDVDHMNMCGSPAKTVRSYGNNWQGWSNHDRYIEQRGMAYYFRTMCPETTAVKMKKAAYKKPAIKKAVKKAMIKKTKIKPIRSITKRRIYNHKLDCARVDNLNGTGAIVRVIRRR